MTEPIDGAGAVAPAGAPPGPALDAIEARLKEAGVRPLLITRWARAATANPNERLVLAQLAYWHGTSRRTGRPRARIGRDGFCWVAKSYSDLAAEVGLPWSTVRKAVGRLCRRGLVVRARYKFRGVPTGHYRVDGAAVADAVAARPGPTRPDPV